ncbi:MAG: VOC family protein [Blastocatellia bacterium]|nr:VOC family protein [Blastocatellia bacterium]
MQPFHLAFPVTDLEATRAFYVDVLGCGLGRESDRWIDFDFFGHQISAHLIEGDTKTIATNAVDSKNVPIPHFGIILEWDRFHTLADRIKAHHIPFIIEPYIRFQGEVGEQATMFFKDPSGNNLEFKAFKELSMVFAK